MTQHKTLNEPIYTQVDSKGRMIIKSIFRRTRSQSFGFNARHTKRFAMIVGLTLLICCVRTHAALNVTTGQTINDVAETVGWQPDDAGAKHNSRKLFVVANNIASMLAYIGVIIVGCIGISFVIWSLCINEHSIPAHAATALGEAEYHTLRSI